MRGNGAGASTIIALQILLLGSLLLFLYFPTSYAAYLSFMENGDWPFPPAWTLAWYERLLADGDIRAALANSLLLGLGTGLLSALLATAGAIGILRQPGRRRGLLIGLYLAPLFVAQLLIGISTLMFDHSLLGQPGGLTSAVLANTTHGLSFAFLIVLAQLLRYDWRLDEVAMACGAGPLRTFLEITLPNIWPAILGAFLVAFILGFNNLEISFQTLGDTPTLPTIAWDTLRQGIEPELHALATLVNLVALLTLGVLYLLTRAGITRLDKLDHRDRSSYQQTGTP